MAEFNLVCKVTCSAYTTVRANSFEEAAKIAGSRGTSLSGRGDDEAEVWIVDDADGLPLEIEAA